MTAWMAVVLARWQPLAAQRARQATGPQAAGPAERVDYNWDVRPILSENCFRCHGPDQKARMAGLRLDTAEGAYAALRSGTKHAIVAGRADESELIKRIPSDNAGSRMPPRQTNKTLTPGQIQTLEKWIAQGAQYK